MKRRKPVSNLDDAMTWLAFMARFCESDMARHARGCLQVIYTLDEDLNEARARCAALAARLEKLEATQQGDGL